jgi:hypothetical protein
MGYIDELILICRYSRDALTNTILLGFHAKVNNLDRLSKKVQKVLAFLNNNTSWFSCQVIKIVGIRVFKHEMKFLESNYGFVAHNIHFEVLCLKKIVLDLKVNMFNVFFF